MSKFHEIASVVGLVSSAAFLYSELTKPPVPKCPSCGQALNFPGTRYSKCHACHQLIDWHTEDSTQSKKEDSYPWK